MQVVDQKHDRLGLGAELDQTAQEGEEPALAHRGLELERGRLRVRNAQEVQYQGAVVSESVVEQRQLAGDLLTRLARPVLLCDPKQVAQQLEQRQVGNRLAVGRAVGFVGDKSTRATAFDELGAQPALADASLSHRGSHTPGARKRSLQRRLQRFDLVAATDEARQSPRRASCPGACDGVRRPRARTRRPALAPL